MVEVTQSQATAQAMAQAASEGKNPATVLSIVTRSEFNPQLVEKVQKLVLGIAKASEGLTGKMFSVIQACTTEHQAKGTFVEAESKACKELGAKSISDANSRSGIKLFASYMAIKSTLFSAIDRKDDLAIVLQELWNFEQEHESKEQRIVPEDFLDPWGLRYKDKDKGHSLFMKDYREASAAGGVLTSKKKVHARAAELATQEAAKKNEAAGAGTQATQGADAGMARSGHTQAKAVLDTVTASAVNYLIMAVHEAYNTLQPEVIQAALDECAKKLNAAVAAKHDETRAIAARAGNKPVIQAEVAQDLPDLPAEPDADGSVDITDEDKEWIEKNAPDVEENGPENAVG
jgi:hypothetical protein